MEIDYLVIPGCRPSIELLEVKIRYFTFSTLCLDQGRLPSPDIFSHGQPGNLQICPFRCTLSAPFFGHHDRAEAVFVKASGSFDSILFLFEVLVRSKSLCLGLVHSIRTIMACVDTVFVPVAVGMDIAGHIQCSWIQRMLEIRAGLINVLHV
ncbi:hypothetical protein VTK56DRAFT_9826 [Thermocarpiscus australiensis]